VREMLWAQVRQAYPNQWLIVEALEAQTTPDNRWWRGYHTGGALNREREG